MINSIRPEDYHSISGSPWWVLPFTLALLRGPVSPWWVLSFKSSAHDSHGTFPFCVNRAKNGADHKKTKRLAALRARNHKKTRGLRPSSKKTKGFGPVSYQFVTGNQR
jgi:hypothetical protein